MTPWTAACQAPLSMGFSRQESGVGCHFLLQNLSSICWKWMTVKVTQSCLTLCNPMDYTVHGILQARILEWVTFPFSKGSSQPRDRTQASHTASGFFTSWATREAHKETGTEFTFCFLILLAVWPRLCHNKSPGLFHYLCSEDNTNPWGCHTD